MAIHIHIHTKDAEVVLHNGEISTIYEKSVGLLNVEKSLPKRNKIKGSQLQNRLKNFKEQSVKNFQQANLLLQQMNKEYPEFTKGFPANSSATGWLRLIK